MVGEDPGVAGADPAKGRQLYERLGCAACHGQAGRANGPSAAGLVDDWGMPIRSANLTQGWNYRGGSEPRSIMLRVLAGIDGSGMPSYAGAVSPEDAWHLAYYVASLHEPAHWNLIASPLRISGELPTDLDDPRWAKAPQTDLRLRNALTPDGEWGAPATINHVSVRAIHNDEAMSFWFSWDDPTEDRGTQAASDRLAVAFKPRGSEGDAVTLHAWPHREAQPLDLCAWSAGSDSATELIAARFEEALGAEQAADQTRVPRRSLAAYADGRWRLILQRPLHPGTLEAAGIISHDGLTAVAVAVWDGGNPEVRAVSAWIDLSLRRPRSSANE
jgi:DMSO reductase family type II enzyme heme b subunit